jgi:hypothetical protein
MVDVDTTQRRSTSSPDEGGAPGGEETKNHAAASPGDDLLAIHRTAVAALAADCNDGGVHQQGEESKEEEEDRLQRLRRRRIAVQAELEALRAAGSKRRRTLGEELTSRCTRRRRPPRESNESSTTEAPVPLPQNSSSGPPSSSSSSTTGEVLQDFVEQQEVAVRMKTLRRQKMLAAAYRLAGISMVPVRDKDVLCVRFDVTTAGSYRNSYHCFFDLVEAIHDDDDGGGDAEEEEEENFLYLRLIQHTLPSAIPLGAILREVGGLMIPCRTDRSTDDLTGRLRSVARKLYHACYCYAVRQEIYTFLRTLTTRHDADDEAADDDDERSYWTDHVETVPGKYDAISFQLHLASGISSLQVHLTYRNPVRVQPTHVTVRNLTRHRTSSEDSEEEEYEEEADVDDLVQTAVTAFRRLPFRKALTEAADAMAEW